jgi:hypothetical protein
VNAHVDVSVIVAVLDEADVIERAAAAIVGQDFEGDVEYLFLDGGSTDGTRQLLDALARRDPRVRVLENPGRTQVRALNAGLRAARGDVVVQMDAHTFYPPHYLSIGVTRLRQGDAGWVSGPPVPEGTGRWSRRMALALRSPLGAGGADKWRAGFGDEEVELDTGVFGGFWRRSTLERLDGWNDDWPVNHDSELAARYLREGGRIVCLPQLASRYVPRDTLPGVWRQYRSYGYYRARTCRHYPETVRPSHLLSLAPVAALLACAFPWTPLRRAAAGGLVTYAATTAIVSARLARSGEPRDALALPAVFAAMHIGWGVGFLAGCWRFGAPVRGAAFALARVPASFGARLSAMSARGGSR